jgi:hypothetical protein
MRNYEKNMQFRSICGIGKRFSAGEALFGRPSDKTIQIQRDFLDAAPTVGSRPPLWRTVKRGQLTEFDVNIYSSIHRYREPTSLVIKVVLQLQFDC